jgi:hypothetical protein
MSDGTDFQKMTRDELNDYASGHGVADAANYANKAELIAALEAAPGQDDVTDDTTDGDDAESGESDDDAESEQSGQRYEVLKAVTDEDGRTYMPGEQFVPGSGFPSRRPKQLVDQKFLRPLE